MLIRICPQESAKCLSWGLSIWSNYSFTRFFQPAQINYQPRESGDCFFRLLIHWHSRDHWIFSVRQALNSCQCCLIVTAVSVIVVVPSPYSWIQQIRVTSELTKRLNKMARLGFSWINPVVWRPNLHKLWVVYGWVKKFGRKHTTGFAVIAAHQVWIHF